MLGWRPVEGGFLEQRPGVDRSLADQVVQKAEELRVEREGTFWENFEAAVANGISKAIR